MTRRDGMGREVGGGFRMGNTCKSMADQPWVFIGRTDAEAETPILWQPDGKELIHLKRP